VLLHTPRTTGVELPRGLERLLLDLGVFSLEPLGLLDLRVLLEPLGLLDLRVLLELLELGVDSFSFVSLDVMPVRLYV
jgi:hypothetical protein